MILMCMFSVTEGKIASVRSRRDSLQTVNVFLLLYVKTHVELKISGLFLLKEQIFLCLGLLPLALEMYRLVYLLTKMTELWYLSWTHGLLIIQRLPQ